MCDFFYFAGEGDQGEDKNDALICSITLKFIPIAWEEQGISSEKEGGKKKPNPTSTQT
jgi:hypothetical protein